MGLTKTTKQAFESYFIHADFSAVLEDSETLILGSSSITVLDNTGNDASSIVADQASKSVMGPELHIRIKDGDSTLSPYKVTFKVITSTGNKWEVDGAIVIKEQ